ncbi:MAG: hypothetical protein NVS3B2_04590 [Ramlibacter sp.]
MSGPGIPGRAPSPLTDEQAETLRTMASRLSLSELAEATGMPRSRARRVLTRLGIVLRTRSEAARDTANKRGPRKRAATVST